MTGQIFSVTASVPEQPRLSVATTVMETPVLPLVGVVGAPLITPVAAVNARPAGRFAEVMANE
jgi:hypothetical protein